MRNPTAAAAAAVKAVMKKETNLQKKTGNFQERGLFRRFEESPGSFENQALNSAEPNQNGISCTPGT